MHTNRENDTHFSKYIYEYPTTKVHEFNHVFDSSKNNLTIGDLHGNPIKLLHTLIDHGIVDFDGDTQEEKARQFQELIDCYHKDGDTIIDYYEYNILFFKKALSKLKFSSHPPLVRLLGDILADRGRNDIFTIFLLAVLNKNRIPLEITLSNHDQEFIRIFTEIICSVGYERFGPFDIKFEATNSVDILGATLHGIAKFYDIKTADDVIEEIKDDVKDSYLSKMKFITYEYDDTTNTFSLFTHAPVGLETLKLIANYFGVQYDDNSVKNLIATIEKINDALPELISSGKLNEIISNDLVLASAKEESDLSKFRKAYENLSMSEINHMLDTMRKNAITDEDHYFIKVHEQYAIMRLIWERVHEKKDAQYDLSDMPKTKNGINFKFKHGHDLPHALISIHDHIFSYDNVRGKPATIDDEKQCHDSVFNRSDQSINTLLTTAHYEDHEETIAWNSLSLAPKIKELDRHFARIKNQMNDSLPQFFQSSDKFIISEVDQVFMELKSLPKKIADEYKRDLLPIIAWLEKSNEPKTMESDKKPTSRDNK